VSDFRAGQARWDATCGAGRRGRLADVRTFASEKSEDRNYIRKFPVDVQQGAAVPTVAGAAPKPALRVGPGARMRIARG